MIGDRAYWARVEEVLDTVLDGADNQHEALLDELCGADTALRTDVLRLLDAERSDAEFLNDAPQWSAHLSATRSSDTPVRIGPFRVLREIGRGGMGVVYLAERVDGEFDQRVALKCIGRWRGGEAVRARFLRERRLLARLDHPNVARLLDGGVTDDGRPYFAMEYVEGESITKHVKRENPGQKERLRLFREICDAVEFAHARMIVHRDLKPSNILVTPGGQVKLLDFGLAKLLDSEGDGLSTRSEERLLTPVYAAPEQLEGSEETAATDVYGLGLVLYELLASRRPFELEGRSFAEHRRDVLERDAPLPCASDVPGATDLNAICLRALRKEPQHRYPSVQALRADLERFLDDLPVEARQGTAVYRAGKFFRRHRVPSIAVAAILLTLVIGSALVWREGRIASNERARAEAIHEFFVEEMIGSITPERARGRDVLVAEVLDAAQRRAGKTFAGRPGLEAEVRRTLGQSWASLGRDDLAREQWSAAIDLFARAVGPDHAQSLNARADLAALDGRDGRGEAALTELHSILDRQRRRLGSSHGDVLRTRRLIAETLIGEGRFLEAQQILESLSEELSQASAGEDRERLAVSGRLCDALNGQRRHGEAEVICRRVFEESRTLLGEDHPHTLKAATGLAQVWRRLDRFDQAASLLESSIPMHERVFGPAHAATVSALNLLGAVHWDRDDIAGAHTVFTAALERAEKAFGPDHPRTIALMQNVAMTSRHVGDRESAEKMYGRAVDALRATRGATHPSTLKALRTLGSYYWQSGDIARAGESFAEAERLSEAAAAEPDADPALLNDYAWFLLTGPNPARHNPARALSIAERAVHLTDRRQPEFLDTLAQALQRTGDLDTAIAIEREALELPDAVHRTDLERTMVELLQRAGRGDELQGFLLAQLDRRRALRPAGDASIGETLRWLGRHATDQARFEEAETWFDEAEGHFRRGLGPDDWRECRVLADRGDLLVAQRRPDDAEAMFRSALRCAEERAGRRDFVLDDIRKRARRLGGE